MAAAVAVHCRGDADRHRSRPNATQAIQMSPIPRHTPPISSGPGVGYEAMNKTAQVANTAYASQRADAVTASETPPFGARQMCRSCRDGAPPGAVVVGQSPPSVRPQAGRAPAHQAAGRTNTNETSTNARRSLTSNGGTPVPATEHPTARQLRLLAYQVTHS